MSRFGKLLASILLACFAAFAQDSTQPPPAATTAGPKHKHVRGDRSEQKLKRLSKSLNLTDDQKEKIRPILQDEEKQLITLDGDTTMTPQQKHRRTRDIRMSSRSQMEAILTPEQKEKMPSGRTHGGRHRMPPGSTAAPGTSDRQ